MGKTCKEYQDDLRINAINDKNAQKDKEALEVGKNTFILLLMKFAQGNFAFVWLCTITNFVMTCHFFPFWGFDQFFPMLISISLFSDEESIVQNYDQLLNLVIVAVVTRI